MTPPTDIEALVGELEEARTRNTQLETQQKINANAITALTKERDEALTESRGLIGSLQDWRVRYQELQQQLTQLQADKERLDWLGDNLAYLQMVNPLNNVMYTLPNKGRGWKDNELRAAIDAAILAEKEKA